MPYPSQRIDDVVIADAEQITDTVDLNYAVGLADAVVITDAVA